MKEIKREITSEQVVYEITKEELDAIRKEERNKGRQDIAGYIGFALSNYTWKMNLGGAVYFLNDMANFLLKDTHTIPNRYNDSLWDYIKKYR